MMEDAMSEDTMMDCEGDSSGLEDLLDLATDVTNTTPNIQDAAERLLYLLGMEDLNDDDLLSSSEDEGVDLDDEESDDDLDDSINTKLVNQLTASLTQELKFAQKQTPLSCKIQPPLRGSQDDQIQCMEVGHETNFQEQNSGVKFETNYHYTETPSNSEVFQENRTSECSDFVPNKRCRLDQHYRTEEPENRNTTETQISSSWDAGWDACAAEAVRYLIEVEGFAPQHPTVIALKNHLEMQRDRAFAQYSS